ncbi:MAG: sugar phosphate isomerase/epimerase [Verrucomicrobia bacterium]|nr:sugar phosphate isomerase/epimerase [Verrucomicrobiota bacterium]
MNRRHFLATSALGSAALCLPTVGADKPAVPKPTPPLVGSQLYGWGQYYERDGKDLYAQLDDVLKALRDSGYDYAEGSLDTQTPDNNARFAERLQKHGLRPVSFYSGGPFHILGKATETAERITRATQKAGPAGFGIINVNPDPIGRPKTDAELAIQAEALTELGAELAKLGFKLGIHHHTPELANEAREFHSNFQKCPKSTVGFCYDVHWVYRGGIPPAQCLPQYGDRIVSWHLRQSRDQIWWEDLDSGDLDYPAVAQFVRAHKIPAFYTVELALEPGTKVTRSAVENHARSRQYVKQVLGV